MTVNAQQASMKSIFRRLQTKCKASSNYTEVDLGSRAGLPELALHMQADKTIVVWVTFDAESGQANLSIDIDQADSSIRLCKAEIEMLFRQATAEYISALDA